MIFTFHSYNESLTNSTCNESGINGVNNIGIKKLVLIKLSFYTWYAPDLNEGLR